MDLREYRIAELKEHFVSGELTAVRLCEAFLARIARIDHAGPTLRSVIEINPDAFRYGLKANLNRYLAEHPAARVSSLQELIRFNQEHAAQVMPFFGQEFFEMAQRKGDLTDKAYLQLKAECRRLSRTDGIDRALRDHQLDAIIAPTEGS